MNINNLFHILNSLSSQQSSNGQNNQSSNGGTGLNMQGGNKGVLIVIIIVIVVMMLMQNQEETNPTNYDNSEYTENYNDQTDYSSSNGSFFDLIFGDSSSSSSNNGQYSNSNYTSYEDSNIKNVSSDTYTVMIYMCGSNLESDGGYASSDLEEMLKSTLADEVNVLIYTGGAKKWFSYGISNRTNQIYKIENHKLVLVKDNLGLENMADSKTLTSFMSFCKQNYSADKYALIFWDHGGGAVSGFGLDQNASKSDTLTIDEIKKSVDAFGSRLEFVGFDACLMANMETAYALKDGANYLIASEETEPGTGWNYVKIFNTLSSDSSQIGSTTGKVIVDSFIASNSGYRAPDATLSCIDLSKMENVYKNLVSFMKEVKQNYFSKSKYNTFSKAVATTKAFSDNMIDTFDLVDFANNVGVSSASKLVSSVNEAVSYNKTNKYVENSNGMSIFIPYNKLSYYDNMLKIYNNIGMTSEYTNVLSEYVNLIANGKKPSYSVNNHTYTQSSSDYSSYGWYDLLFRSNHEAYYEQTELKVEKLNVVDKGDYFALHLTDKDWEKITKVESVTWYDAGKGYIDMGADSIYELDQKGDLKIESDGTWLAINGDNIHYEVIERTDNYEKGRVPAVINKERVNLILYFDKENPDGVVLGYAPDYDELGQTVFEKGLREIKVGDKIDFVANYYAKDGSLDDEFYINDTLVVDSKGLNISYESLGDGECLIYYRLTDTFGNIYYTEPVILE